jgi:hypothetical protein
VRRYAGAALAAIALLALTFLAGRATAPAREKIVEHVSAREKVAETKVARAIE